jgi:hypothetical protein
MLWLNVLKYGCSRIGALLSNANTVMCPKLLIYMCFERFADGPKVFDFDNLRCPVNTGMSSLHCRLLQNAVDLYLLERYISVVAKVHSVFDFVVAHGAKLETESRSEVFLAESFILLLFYFKIYFICKRSKTVHPWHLSSCRQVWALCEDRCVFLLLYILVPFLLPS